MSTLGRALLDQLDADDLAELRRRLALDPPLPAEPADGWLDSTAAAAYLGISRHALHRLTSDRRLPCSQDAPGGKLFFRRSALDDWRLGGQR